MAGDRFRGAVHPASAAPQRYAFAVADATFNPGTIVKTTGSPFKVTQAADGDSVYGVAVTTGESGVACQVLIEGETWVKAKSTASWASTRRVVAAGSDEVDQGSADDPYFATLLEHDATRNLARIYIHSDAMPRVARSLNDASDVTWPLGTLSAGRPLVLGTGSGKVLTPLHVGSSASRPSSPFTGQTYWDSDIAENLVYDGTRWRSATLHQFVCGRVNGVAASTNDMNLIASNAMSDATMPFIIDKDARVVGCYFSLKGGTGSIAWTLRLRLDGSGSDTFAGAARTSSTSWQAFSETIDQAVTAGQRLRWLANTGGSTETLQAQVLTSFVYT